MQIRSEKFTYIYIYFYLTEILEIAELSNDD